MKCINKIISRSVGLTLFLSVFAFRVYAQNSSAASDSGNGWFYAAVFIALIGLGCGYYFWRKSQHRSESTSKTQSSEFYGSEGLITDNFDLSGKGNSTSSNTPSINYRPKKSEKLNDQSILAGQTSFAGGMSIDTKVFKDRIKMLQYSQLPINWLLDLTPAKHFEPLPEDNSKKLLDAIERVHDEDEDESDREAAIKTLAGFKTSNSVDALSQTALYDLSAAVRSKAVTALADLDHESVFENILLACADPSREVRAAAARGLFRLSFDRAGAWKRIIETHDEFRMSQAVRAAVESGIVPKSFDRLLHEDVKIAYEAFTLVALLIKSGDNKEIFEALRNHKDMRVQFALLHVIKIVKDARSLAGLNELRQSEDCSPEVKAKIEEALQSLEQLAGRIAF